MTTTVTLQHDTTPEAAETAVWQAITNHPGQVVIVRLHGFSTAAFGRIVSRLPNRFSPNRTSLNVWVLNPAGSDGFTASVVSGRFDAAGTRVAEEWQRERDAGASLIFGTELASRTRATLLGGDRRYGLIHHRGVGVGENALEFARADWDVVRTFTHQVLPGGGSGRFAQPASVLVTVLRNVHNDKVFIDVQNHDPAHLLPSSHFYRPGNMARWLRVKRAQGALLARLEAQHPGAALAVTGDSNAPQRAPFFLRAMARFFPGFHDGGGYEFGAAWVKGLTATHAQTLDAHGGSDHPVRRIGFRWSA